MWQALAASLAAEAGMSTTLWNVQLQAVCLIVACHCLNLVCFAQLLGEQLLCLRHFPCAAVASGFWFASMFASAITSCSMW